MPKHPLKIPYGISDYEAIRTRNYYYVDKTRFLRLLEQYNYVVFIRPRRFGKSSWVALMSGYYDKRRVDQFETLFGGTDIGAHPTEERNQYLILAFNFSLVSSVKDQVEASFETYCKEVIRNFLETNQADLPLEFHPAILALPTASSQLNALFVRAMKLRLKIYVLIDEYDNFANTILTESGSDAYHEITHGDGFYRHFFSVLKGGTSEIGASVARLFMTGVSPVTLDDVTSGFNIGRNLSQNPEFHDMLGFTVAEVQTMLEYYQQHDRFPLSIPQALELMQDWYGNYQFYRKSQETLFNTDMVLYFVSEVMTHRGLPSYLIDQNVRIDYGKLRHLILLNRQLNGNFDQLKTIIEEEKIVTEVEASFSLDQMHRPQNFNSLLYYFGLLTFQGTYRGSSLLAIPNQTVKHLIYGYLRNALEEAKLFTNQSDIFIKLIQDMAWSGEWQPVFNHLAQQIEQQTSIRDYLSAEKVIQGFLLAYLNVSDVFLCRTEQEFHKGFADLFLEPFVAKYPDIQYGFLIELKYIKRNDWDEKKAETLLNEAQEQLTQYFQDERLQRWPHVQFTGIVLLFCGWELKAMRNQTDC